MLTILVATARGCVAWSESGKTRIELAGRQVSALCPEQEGTCLAVVDDHQIWRRSRDHAWTQIATVDIPLQSIVAANGVIFGGGLDDAVMIRVSASGGTEALHGFIRCPGREKWFASGPPLGVRSLAGTSDGKTIIAAVHVGGLPYSTDQGSTWTPSVPIAFDVHEVRAHSTMPHVVLAAAAVGLCVSHDGARTWRVIANGLELTNSLAVAILEDEILFSIADGPWAKQSQLWHWQIGSDRVHPVLNGLPEWLDGKLDTAHIAANHERAAFFDGEGNLWLSASGITGWKRVAHGLVSPLGLALWQD